MFRDRAVFIIGIVLSAALLAAAIWKNDGMTVGTCVTALAVSVPVAIYCPRTVSNYSLLSSLVLVICTSLMLIAVPYDSMFQGYVSSIGWACVSAFILGIALIFQTLFVFFFTAAAFKASYNWVLVSGLGWIIGLGLMLVRYITVLIFQNTEAEEGLLVNPILAFGMLVDLIMFIVAFVIIGRIMKKGRCLITSNGPEAMR